MEYRVWSMEGEKCSMENDVSCMEGGIQNANLHSRHTPYAIRYTSRASRGSTVILVLAFMGIFGLITGGISGYVLQQGNYGRATTAREQAVQVAEAGIEYYRWYLAHNPSVLVSGSGLASPYTHQVNDPEGGNLGNAVITATSNLQCGALQWIDLESRGVSNANPDFPRTLLARYMKPAVAEYSYLLNSNVWAGADRQILGPYHSNGGIRMDGTNNSNVTSAVSTWSCTSSFGCNPTQTKPGVWGAGSGNQLWSYPVSTVNFAGIASNFADLQSKAGTSGIALYPTLVKVGGVQQGSSFSSVGGNDQRGFHLVFNPGGTVTIFRVTGTSYVNGTHLDTLAVEKDYHTITSEVSIGTFTVPSACSLIFSQAKTWIEGTISGKVTLVAADTGSFSPDLILSGNINYATSDGTSGLSAIAERSVLIPLVVPNAMSIRGVFVAQSGSFGRNLYDCLNAPYDIRTSLTMSGTVVSNTRTGTKWTYSNQACQGSRVSGFQTRVDSYDRLLSFAPSPFTPSSSVDYKLSLWRER